MRSRSTVAHTHQAYAFGSGLRYAYRPKGCDAQRTLDRSACAAFSAFASGCVLLRSASGWASAGPPRNPSRARLEGSKRTPMPFGRACVLGVGGRVFVLCVRPVVRAAVAVAGPLCGPRSSLPPSLPPETPARPSNTWSPRMPPNCPPLPDSRLRPRIGTRWAMAARRPVFLS